MKRSPVVPDSRPEVVFRYGSGTIHGLPVWAALSERGLCCLRFLAAGQKKPRLEQVLSGPGRNVCWLPAQAEMTRLFRQIEDWLDGRRKAVTVPLDLVGTAFQRRIWRLLQTIPRGQTWSYTELARRAGKPKAVRAAANACARNPVVLLVPCHRVIAKDGSLGGYGGGRSRKQALLARERHVGA